MSTITIESINQFSGDVDLTTAFVGASPTGVNVKVIPSRVNVNSGGSSTADVVVAATDAPSAGTFKLTAKGVSQWLHLSRTADLSVNVSCACAASGMFKGAEVVEADTSGFSPDKTFQVKASSIGGAAYIKVVKLSTNSIVVPDTLNPAAWGFSRTGNFFVVASNFNASLNSFALKVYDLLRSKKTIDTTVFLCANTTAGDCTPPTKVCNCLMPKGSETVSIANAAWGFSPDGKTFLLVYTPRSPAAKYVLSLYRTDTGANVLFANRNDFSSVWQFSPCGDLLMLITQPASVPTTTDHINFYSTRQNKIYGVDPILETTS